QWRLAELHELATGRGVKVAVIDSGIEARHPDLAGQLTVNRNFIAGRAPAFEQHGTGVAGIIAAKADNHIGIAGVAPGARLLGLRACWQASSIRTVCDSFSLVKALYFAVGQKAEVINMSLSGPDDRLLTEL
ncbi:MAG: S8 family peptidase, partial [Sphingomicrobium sp.]